MIPIDLRSDTVTQPTPEMREAMFAAPLGDDVYGEDETVNALQTKIAEMFGKEAALFCPSGTMTNQIAIKVLTQPLDEVICYKGAHIYKYEGGGMFFNSQVSVKLPEGNRGRLALDDILKNINLEDVHFPKTRLVALENTANRGGGATYTAAQVEAIARVCQQNKLGLHLDGARIFNALVANEEHPFEHGQYFDTISVCLSKGLGCPVGSVLLGSQEIIQQAKRIRKVLGGGMRQAGFLAAAGIYALDNHIYRLAEDHQRAKIIMEELIHLNFIESIMPVETNIVLANTRSSEDLLRFYHYLRDNHVKIGLTEATQFRMVTHLDFDNRQLNRLVELIRDYE
ncbi:MAG: aminotransferase class I/II-fold pyridoxal phosphate-dependent enzyme [Microscillaceae bacterium]|jgi:threonine aldolase|nr:aminotransferase class I/II-fold pyridoxal phosphate-dependent enzyme [Microscillaceae bacterium]